MITSDKLSESHHIVLQPNRSATWFESKLMIAFMVMTVLTIAVGWLVVGVWMILPFAGIEVGLFAFLMYAVSRQTYRKQIIELDRAEIKVTNRLGNRTQKLSLLRVGTFIDIVETERDWNLPKLYLVNDNTRIPIGEFLNLNDRKQLKTVLEKEGLPTCRTHWWKTDN